MLFHNGKLYTIKGGTDKHAEILANFATAINNALFINDDESTHVYSSDMRIRINAVNKGTYPDVTVLKGEPEYYLNAPQIILNPTLIVEVLSKSTQKYDKGLKFDHYKTLESFREYVLVAQDSPHVEVHFLKNPAENLWEVTTYEGLANDVTLQSIGCTVKMKQIYHRIFK